MSLAFKSHQSQVMGLIDHTHTDTHKPLFRSVPQEVGKGGTVYDSEQGIMK